MQAFLLGEQTGLRIRQQQLQQQVAPQEGVEQQVAPQEGLKPQIAPQERVEPQQQAVPTAAALGMDTRVQGGQLELSRDPGTRRFVPTTLQAILHAQAREKKAAKPVKPKWKSQWISIFGSNYL